MLSYFLLFYHKFLLVNLNDFTLNVFFKKYYRLLFIIVEYFMLFIIGYHWLFYCKIF
jgi:hypothetical protein